MSESTFHMTHEDLRKPESQVSQKNNGNIPAESEVAQTKVTLLVFLFLQPSLYTNPTTD